MPSDAQLRAVADTVIRSLATLREQDCNGRYDLAVLISNELQQSHYGDRTAERLAGFLGWTVAYVYRFARVAERFTRQQYRNLTRRRTNRRGMRWSDVCLLAAVPTARRRISLTSQYFANGWRYADLFNAIYGYRPNGQRSTQTVQVAAAPQCITPAPVAIVPSQSMLQVPVLLQAQPVDLLSARVLALENTVAAMLLRLSVLETQGLGTGRAVGASALQLGGTTPPHYSPTPVPEQQPAAAQQ